MWLDWLVFCDYGFSVSALWCPLATLTILLGFPLPWMWGISSRLFQQSAATAPYLGWGVSPHCHPSWPWTWAMLSKSLIQLSVHGQGCVPSLLFDLRPNCGAGNEDSLLQKDSCMHCYTLYPQPCSRPLLTHASTVYSWNFQTFKLNLEKAEEWEIKLPTSVGSLKKQESSRKTSISALLTMPKPLCGSQ